MKKIITPKHNGSLVTFPGRCFHCNPAITSMEREDCTNAWCDVRITCDERNTLVGLTGFKPADAEHLELLRRLLHKATGGSETWVEENGSVYVHPDDVSLFVSFMMDVGVTQTYAGRNQHLAHI